MSRVTPGTTITLSLALEDGTTPSNNPITGQSTEVSIRRLSDDAWWDFLNSEWDAIAFAARTSDHKGALTGKGDGSYERDWDQGANDASATRDYLAYFAVTSVGDFENQVTHEIWSFSGSDAVGTNTVNFTVDDGATPLQGATVGVSATAGGVNIRTVVTNSLGTVSTKLDPGTYYIQATLNGFSHTETTMVVDEDPEAVAISMTGVSISSPSGSAIRVWAWPQELDTSTDVGTEIPLFRARLSFQAQTIIGLLVETSVDAVLHGDGYWYVDIYALDDLTSIISGRTLTYEFTTRTGDKVEKDVNTADGPSANLIRDLD